METLTQEDPEKLGGWAIAALVALPIMAFLVSAFSLLSGANEPFLVLTVKDAMVFYGGLSLVVIMWIGWGWIVRQRKLGTDVWVPVLLWAAVTLLFATLSAYEYSRQPWTRNEWAVILQSLTQ